MNKPTMVLGYYGALSIPDFNEPLQKFSSACITWMVSKWTGKPFPEGNPKIDKLFVQKLHAKPHPHETIYIYMPIEQFFYPSNIMKQITVV